MTDIEDLVSQPTGRMKWVISASRRTDIPGKYMAEYAGYFRSGKVSTKVPRSSKRITYSLSPSDVAAVMWWSKNYEHWLREYDSDPEFWPVYTKMVLG